MHPWRFGGRANAAISWISDYKTSINLRLTLSLPVSSSFQPMHFSSFVCKRFFFCCFLVQIRLFSFSYFHTIVFFREETDERISCQQDLYLGDTQFLIWLKHRLMVLACILLYQSLLFWSHFKEQNGIQGSAIVATAVRMDLDEFHWELQTWFTAAAGLEICNQMFKREVFRVSNKHFF